jgi:hypothetical protein
VVVVAGAELVVVFDWLVVVRGVCVGALVLGNMNGILLLFDTT